MKLDYLVVIAAFLGSAIAATVVEAQEQPNLRGAAAAAVVVDDGKQHRRLCSDKDRRAKRCGPNANRGDSLSFSDEEILPGFDDADNEYIDLQEAKKIAKKKEFGNPDMTDEEYNYRLQEEAYYKNQERLKREAEMERYAAMQRIQNEYSDPNNQQDYQMVRPRASGQSMYQQQQQRQRASGGVLREEPGNERATILRLNNRLAAIEREKNDIRAKDNQSPQDQQKWQDLNRERKRLKKQLQDAQNGGGGGNNNLQPNAQNGNQNAKPEKNFLPSFLRKKKLRDARQPDKVYKKNPKNNGQDNLSRADKNKRKQFLKDKQKYEKEWKGYDKRYQGALKKKKDLRENDWYEYKKQREKLQAKIDKEYDGVVALNEKFFSSEAGQKIQSQNQYVHDLLGGAADAIKEQREQQRLRQRNQKVGDFVAKDVPKVVENVVRKSLSAKNGGVDVRASVKNQLDKQVSQARLKINGNDVADDNDVAVKANKAGNQDNDNDSNDNDNPKETAGNPGEAADYNDANDVPKETAGNKVGEQGEADHDINDEPNFYNYNRNDGKLVDSIEDNLAPEGQVTPGGGDDNNNDAANNQAGLGQALNDFNAIQDAQMEDIVDNIAANAGNNAGDTPGGP